MFAYATRHKQTYNKHIGKILMPYIALVIA